MSENHPAQMPTVPQPGLKDTPIVSNHDSNSNTSTDTPIGDIFSNDGVGDFLQRRRWCQIL